MFRFVVILAVCQAALADDFYRSEQTSDREYLYQYKTGAWLDDFEKHRLPMGISAGVEHVDLPEQFDARDKWTKCPSLREIRNQGCCGSCWAISAASVMSDRWCILSENNLQFSFGAFDLMGCCTVVNDRECGNGCNGGYLGPAWDYWVAYGISSGGPYDSGVGCHSYPAPKACSMFQKDFTPACQNKCQASYNVTKTRDDLRFGRNGYWVPEDEQRIMEEIYTNGPVQASFVVYMDFMEYTGGVYRHTYGPQSGGHAIKLLGWGVENGTKYWLAANSWGQAWGDKGYFKFTRGENHLNIEANVHAGIPHYTKHKEREY